jgi:hypothetical protein
VTYTSVLQRTASLAHPDPAMIGRFTVDGKNIDFPVSESDLDRDTQWCCEVLRGYGLGAGDHILLSSHAWFCPWVDPIRTAATGIGAVYSNVEAWAWDVHRMASFLRRFRITMLAGLGAESLTALQSVGDIEELLGGVKRILAWPDAIEPLRTKGFQPGVVTRVGPSLAMSAPDGRGLVVNDAEWSVQSVDGEFTVTSGRMRTARFDQQRTGVRGQTIEVDGRIRLELES